MSTFTDYPAVVPHLVVKGASKAIAYYQAAFGAQERYRLGTTGTDQIGHAELLIQGQVIMLADEFPGMSTSPQTLKGTTVTFVLMVKDADAAFARAIRAGGTPLMPPTDQFYGYRMGSLLDPFGHKWMIQHPLQAVSVEEMQRRWDDMVRQFSAPKQN
jgi:PhnB protein